MYVLPCDPDLTKHCMDGWMDGRTCLETPFFLSENKLFWMFVATYSSKITTAQCVVYIDLGTRQLLGYLPAPFTLVCKVRD